MDYSQKWKERNAKIRMYSSAVSLNPDSREGVELSNRIKDDVNSDKQFRKYVSKMQNRAEAVAYCFDMNGAQLYVDKYLRKFLEEYNSRLFRGYGAQLPASFNIMRAFVEPDDQALVFRLLDEEVYSISINILLDYITDPSIEFDKNFYFREIEEFKICEVNMFGGYADFSMPGDDEHIFCGAAYVREHDEISVVGIFGKKNPDTKPELWATKDGVFFPGKEFIKKDKEEYDVSDELLFDNPKYSPLILMMRIDVSERKIQARYALEEKKDIFNVLTDDPQAFEIPGEVEGLADRVQESKEKLQKYNGMFSFLELLPYTSRLVRDRDDDLQSERHPTLLRQKNTSSIAKTVKKYLSQQEISNYVMVRTLAGSDFISGSFDIPNSGFKTEIRGYWRTLPLGTMGADKFGHPVQGKTWVTLQENWYEASAGAAESDVSATKVDINPKSDAIGYIYVMRSAIHPKDVYKVGYTVNDPNDRASQLSSATGQYDNFNVVQSWHVRGPRELEREIHLRLKQFRLNKRREFFCLKYEKIREVIEEVSRNFIEE